MNQEQRLQELQSELSNLLAWKREDEKQQIRIPVGPNTRTIMQTDHFVVQKKNIITGSTAVSLEIDIGGTIYYLPAIKD